MPTDKQRAANRRNSQNSSGPKTREGKFKSSLNALKHGVYSHQHIIKTEDEDVFNNFTADFLKEFDPQTPSELHLVQTLIKSAWRGNRLSAILNTRINDAIDAVATEPTEDPTQTTLEIEDTQRLTVRAFERLEDQKPSFAYQEAHELRLAGLFQRTLTRLERSRKITSMQKMRNEANFDLNSLSRAA